MRSRSLTMLVLGIGVATPAAAQVPDSAALMRHVRALAHDSMEGRLVGSPGGARARAYIVRAFEAAGLQRVGAAYEHPFEVQPQGNRPLVRGVNVVGLVPGRVRADRYIVLTAHYDHLGVRGGQIFNGADDNASGTAAIIEVAAYFRLNALDHSLLVVAFDGEEGGLNGARAFVANPSVPESAIVVNVNLDMIGRNSRNELYAAGAYHSPVLRVLLDSVVARSQVTLRLGHDSGGGQEDWTLQSDHGAFHRRHIPFVYFGEEDHADYHRPTDDPEGLMPAFFAGAVATVVETVRVLDRNLAAIAAASAPGRRQPN